MYGFNGDFRQKPVQSLGGASKNEQKDSLLKRAQEERQKREDTRVKNASATRIQAFFKGYTSRKILYAGIRSEFDNKMSKKDLAMDVPSMMWCSSKLGMFFKCDVDGQRLILLCQRIIKYKEVFVQSSLRDTPQFSNQLSSLLRLIIRYLQDIAYTSTTIAIPMRMLEIFLSPSTFPSMDTSQNSDKDMFMSHLWLSLIRNGYFECLRQLLNSRVPTSLEKSPEPPTPVAESIFDLIMKPVEFASTASNQCFRQIILHSVAKTFLCQRFTDQIALFVLPAMAYGKYPFPFVELIQTLIQVTLPDKDSSKATDSKDFQRTARICSEESPWLLMSVLMLATRELENVDVLTCVTYLKLLQRLLLQLPAFKHNKPRNEDDSDSEDEMESDLDTSLTNPQNVSTEIVRLLDSAVHLKCIYNCLMKVPVCDFIESLASISYCLLTHQRMAMHRIRLLYMLAFNPDFMRHLWNQCISSSVFSVTGSSTSLLSMLANGIPLSKENVGRIVPLLTTFCCLFNHSLLTLHDADFYRETEVSGASMPFSLHEVGNMCSALRDACLGIIELAYPDSRVTISDDYRIALKKTGALHQDESEEELAEQTLQWAHLFKSISTLVRQLHSRDSRRAFCPQNHWLAPNINIRTDRPAQIYATQDSIFVRRDLGSLSHLTKTNAGTDVSPLANRDVRNMVILTELPFVVPFLDRVKILQNLINVDKRDHQGEISHFGMGPAISINIRRNFIYEDAFEKLSPENESNLKKKMRVKLLNAAGLDEAGIDGGGIFREFLSELLITGLDPNRGFFKYTAESADRLLYPNPEAALLAENFTAHYYFLGRMLGKALMENLMVEIPLASFFLTKILSPSNSGLDIHYLQLMDPLMYKNLLYLKHYDGDVSELRLDFTVVNNHFGEVKVEDLKPGGSDIPVTNANRIEYIHLMSDYKLNKQIRAHCIAFRKGLNDVVQLEWLQMFNSGEFQVLISGAAVPIDLEDLRRHTKYSGEYNDSHPAIELFWVVVNEFTDQQKRLLLKFVTSCSRPPLLGFRDLYPAFCIHSAGAEVGRLPTASTCMNLLKLPRFEDQKTMKTKLLYAVESGAGFELS